MIRRLRALWQQLVKLGDPFAVDTDWHHDLDPPTPLHTHLGDSRGH